VSIGGVFPLNDCLKFAAPALHSRDFCSPTSMASPCGPL
jgi:hypothetical protein